ncbi:GNAT family N-acetyltransferase, partial [Peribacillus frigoritolerans]|uniref:GNAT family N-acetyltransferase n=1 Tax=Peribacillus frigoritolerans TaxID=450367 RepID=UPI0020244B2F
IGFARAVSDGKFRAYIEDVIIHKAYQKSGIGKNLVSKLLDELSHIDVVSLFCEEHLIPFYKKKNFKDSKSQFVVQRKCKHRKAN